jgi:hypothetical protein
MIFFFHGPLLYLLNLESLLLVVLAYFTGSTTDIVLSSSLPYLFGDLPYFSFQYTPVLKSFLLTVLSASDGALFTD